MTPRILRRAVLQAFRASPVRTAHDGRAHRNACGRTNLPLNVLRLPVCAALLCVAAGQSLAPAAAGQRAGLSTLSGEQLRAVGIVIAAAPLARMPLHIEAIGRVLDPSLLVADAGRLRSARARAIAAAAETARLRGLYQLANASLKALQRAEVAQAAAQAGVQQAQAELRLHWGPLAWFTAARRAQLLGQLADGRALLLRADVLGRQSLGVIPARALIDVDGLEVPARVLGPLPRSAAVLSVGLLLQIPHPPLGLGAGARLPVILEGAEREGRVVPDGALLYGQQGVYVYRALPGKTQDGDTQFEPLRVTLLQSVGSGWLVSGLHAGDRLVVQGAGVLWSLKGLSRGSGGDD